MYPSPSEFQVSAADVTMGLIVDIYRYALHNDVSVNDGPHVRRWSHKIMILHYHCVRIAYIIQYSNMLYRFVA